MTLWIVIARWYLTEPWQAVSDAPHDSYADAIAFANLDPLLTKHAAEWCVVPLDVWKGI